MEQADVGFVYLSVYEMTYTCVKKLLGVKELPIHL